jgi:hypothetical protein
MFTILKTDALFPRGGLVDMTLPDIQRRSPEVPHLVAIGEPLALEAQVVEAMVGLPLNVPAATNHAHQDELAIVPALDLIEAPPNIHCRADLHALGPLFGDEIDAWLPRHLLRPDQVGGAQLDSALLRNCQQFRKMSGRDGTTRALSVFRVCPAVDLHDVHAQGLGQFLPTTKLLNDGFSYAHDPTIALSATVVNTATRLMTDLPEDQLTEEGDAARVRVMGRGNVHPDYQWIIDGFTAVGKIPADLARAMGWSASIMSRQLHGGRDLKQREAQKIVRIFKSWGVPHEKYKNISDSLSKTGDTTSAPAPIARAAEEGQLDAQSRLLAELHDAVRDLRMRVQTLEQAHRAEGQSDHFTKARRR